jgi:hypothetical protein
LDGNRGDNDRILAAVEDGRNPVRTLPGLGQLRQRLELHDLAAERNLNRTAEVGNPIHNFRFPVMAWKAIPRPVD